MLRISEWSGLPEHVTESLNRIKRFRKVERNQILFEQGQQNEGIYTVNNGLFAQRIVHENGTNVIVGLARPGDILGARAFLRNSPHATMAQALVPSSVCLIRRKDAIHLTQDNPEAHMALVTCCLRALDASHDGLMHNAALSTRARLCVILLGFCQSSASDTALYQRFDVPLSRPDLAGMLGILPESLSRLLSQLRKEGIVSASGRSFEVPSRLKLAEAAGNVSLN